MIGLLATAAANVAADIRSHREVVVLNAIMPDTVIVSIRETLLEESRHVFLRRRIALVILTNALSFFRSVITRLARLPEVSSTAKGLAPSFTRDRKGIAVDKGHIAIRCSGAWEKAFELGVASLGIGLSAYEHGAAGPVIWRHTDLAARGAERACFRAPDACIGVMPVRIVICKADAFLRRGSINFQFLHVHTWVDGGRPIVCAGEVAFIILARSGHGLAKGCWTAGRSQEEQVGLRIELHVEGQPK